MDPTEPTQPPSDPPTPGQPPPPQTQLPPSQPPPSSIPPQPSSSSSVHPSSASPISSSPNTNPNPKTLTPLLQQESQPQQQQQQKIQQLGEDQKQEQQQQFSGFQSAQSTPALGRQWQQASHLSHFQPHHLATIPGPSTSSAASSPSPVPSSVVSAPPRGGTTIGVPAIRPGLTAQPNAFASGFGYGGVPRNPTNASEPPNNSSPSTGRPPMHGVQTMGTIGSQMQSGVTVHPGNHQQRPVQLSYRPPTGSINQSSPSQSFQGHGIIRASPVGPPSSAVPSTSQSTQNQAWLSSVSHGRPPVAMPPSRAQMHPQSLQQKSQMTPPPHHAMPSTSQQLQLPASQQQPPPITSNQQREHPGQQSSASRNPQSTPSQQQIARVQGSTNQKSSSTAMAQPGTMQSIANDSVPIPDIDELNKRIINKRSIQELVNQIDPSVKLDPEVEDILIDIAEEFVESSTTFGCSLAKHRQSNTLEAKDILLHLERNWSMTLPGFGGDEIKTYKKPLTNDIHRERLTVVRKSIAGAEMGNTKSSAGQASANAKGHLAKALPNVSGP